jgi:hypothetical protein
MGSSSPLLKTELWSENHGKVNTADLVALEHARARSVCLQSGSWPSGSYKPISPANLE